MMMVKIDDKEYMMVPNGMLIDPDIQRLVGVLNADTGVIEPLNTAEEGCIDLQSFSNPERDCDEDPTTIEGWCERGEQLATEAYFHSAASAYSEALKLCESAKATDL